MEKKIYYFVDESGDPTFFDRRGRLIVGEPGCSSILIIGFIKCESPEPLRKKLTELRKEIAQDTYLKGVPSLEKSLRSFHAKDDCPEVREKVYKLIKSLDFKAQFVVARKRPEIFKKRHNNNENTFYNELVSRLMENRLHQNDNTIYFSKRGSKNRQVHLEQAIRSAVLSFESKHNTKIETATKILIQVPTDEPCLQIIDYMNWALQRAYTAKDMRYLSFIDEKISFICDIYDFDKYPKNFYSKSNKFDINRISPL